MDKAGLIYISKYDDNSKEELEFLWNCAICCWRMMLYKRVMGVNSYFVFTLLRKDSMDACQVYLDLKRHWRHEAYDD